MSDEKIVQLISKLHDRTEAGRIQWKKTTSNGVYQVAFPQNTIRICKKPTKMGTGRKDVVVQIYNSDDALIEEIADPDLIGKIGKSSDDSYLFMNEMYVSARRIAEGVDKAIDSILESLQGGDTDKIPL